MPDTTTTLAVARVDMLQMAGAIQPRLSANRVTSAAGSIDGTVVYFNALRGFADESFEDSWWLVLPDGIDGASSLEAKRISGFDQVDASGRTVLTVHGAFSGQAASGVAAYISPLHPEMLRLALNAAATAIYPDVYAPRRYRHIRGSRAFNGCFDCWGSSLPVWWAVDDAKLVVTASYDPYIGDRAVKLVNGDSSEHYLYSRPLGPAWLNELDGQKVTLHALLSMGTVGHGTLDIVDGAGSDTDATAATADGTWEEVITVERTMVMGLADESARIEFRVTVAAGATVYVGAVWTEGGPAQRYVPVPVFFHRGPSAVKEAGKEFPSHEQDYLRLSGWELTNRYPAADTAGTLEIGHTVRFPSGLSASPRTLLMEGEDYLSEASSETDVYEVAAPQKEMLYALALARVRREMSQEPGTATLGLSRLLSEDWMGDYEDLRKRPGMAMPRKPIVLNPMFGPPPIGPTRGLDEGENE